MTPQTWQAWTFVIANVGIAVGYIFLAAIVMPRITIRLWQTRVGSIGFFTLCGLHHLDNVFHLLLQRNETVGHIYVQAHMLLIDVPQAICVYLFVIGLYIELVKWGPWGEEQRERESRERLSR